MTDAARTPTALDAIADAHVTRSAELNPYFATSIGLAGYDHLTPDFSPAGLDAVAALARETLAALDQAAPADEIDEVTVAAMRERLGLELELHEANEFLGQINNIASPVQELRDILDLMPKATPEHWENIAARLLALPEAAAGIIESWRLAASRGRVAAVRQVDIAIAQAEELAAPGSFFDSLVSGEDVDAALDESAPCQAIRADLAEGATAARLAYAALVAYLRDELRPQAPTEDAFGRERYALWSRYFVGAAVDLEETYAWGLAELASIIAEQEEVAARIAGPGATLEQAIAALDADPARTLHGKDALRRWMQATSDAAIEALDGKHFDISGPLRRLECMIAPTQNGGIYYTGPSDDWTRPGQMWWSVPPDVTTFTTWREKTTVYHEGVPGHHLQIASAVAQKASLNSWRRLACWGSGHGEGGARYAERLMADLGFLDDPGDRLGMLDGQRMRAARVVLDIGVHLGLPCPEEWGGGTWDADKAWEFFKANVSDDESSLRFEVDRYLGWGGQAPSYKIGQRLWEQARDGAAAAPDHDARAFHARALALGSLPLDVLVDALV